MLNQKHDKVVNADLDALRLLMLETIYPVGSIYMSVNNISPSTLFGGTWEAIQDRFLLAAGTSYSGGTTGGSATHTPSGTLSGGAVGNHALTVAEMPSHNHTLNSGMPWGWGWTNATESAQVSVQGGYWGNNALSANRDNTTTWIGGNGAHNHPFTQPTFTGTSQNTLPPYLTVYIWKRVS